MSTGEEAGLRLAAGLRCRAPPYRCSAAVFKSRPSSAARPSYPRLLPCCSPTDTCPCPCNYATDPTCACRDLKENITVAATKSAVYARYPLTFYKYMNGRPYEVR